MATIARFLVLLVVFYALALLPDSAAANPDVKTRFEVSLGRDVHPDSVNGRLLVVLALTNVPEPRTVVGDTWPTTPHGLARDVTQLSPGNPIVLDQSSFSFPARSLVEIPAADYFVQALFDSNTDLRSTEAPGNLYSQIEKIHFDPTNDQAIKLELTEKIPPDRLPDETDLVKFVRLESNLLSRFHKRPIFLRAGVVLPRDYANDPTRRYPLWVRIGGINTRYDVVLRMRNMRSDAGRTWLADETPRLILVQLDGAGPFGDPYYVNSENNGPFGDALTQELIPYIETKFRGMGRPGTRVLSGTSTGGWVSLALQIFYPDYFAGAWSSCPDPVDFRAMQAINLYKDHNAYVDDEGKERPSTRDLKGNVIVTMRTEVGSENLLGLNNCYTTSGQQWGEWTATFSPRGANGLPMPIWDPSTGEIDRQVVEHWKKYDLRLHLERNWVSLAPKLRHKLHIAAGEADQYYLNAAVHLLDEFVSVRQPSIEAKIVYGKGKGHGWFDLSQAAMLKEMAAAIEK